MNIQNEIKTVSNKLHGLGLLVVVIFLLGFLSGIFWCERSYTTRFEDAVKLGGVIHSGIVYDVKERINE